MKNGMLVAATAVLALLAGGGGWASGRALAGPSDAPAAAPAAPATASPTVTPSATPTPTASPSATPEELLEAAKRATVRLIAPGQSLGSGTIISEDGLVLTNAHVAANQAPGLAFQYADPATEPDPEHLIVGLSPPGDGPAVDTYRATPLVADGYLDLAVARIDAMADGSPLPEGLRFDALPLGSVDDLSTGDSITVLGYPGVAAQGEAQSVTRGEIATFARDPEGRVEDGRYEIDTSARIAGGNSGGAAIDEAGRLIGVPSATIVGSEYSGRIRPVDLALPLIEAARSDSPGDYVTPYDVLGTGEEQGEPVGWGTGDGLACEDHTADELAAGEQEMTAAVELSGMTEGEDMMYALARPSRQEPLARYTTTWDGPGSEGCRTSRWSSSDIGAPEGFPSGEYELRVHAGPQLRLVTTVPLVLS